MITDIETEVVNLERGRQAAPQIYELLRSRIVTLRLPPGTVLSRSALMEQFGVSQTPIRDALMRLAEEKLVDIFAQHSTSVSRIDVKEARQAHFMRQALELEVVRALCEREDRSFIRPIRHELERQQQMLDQGDLIGFQNCEMDFHHRLCVAAEVPALWALIRSHAGHLDRLRRLYYPSPADSSADHMAVLAAIEARDVGKGQQVLRRHMSRTLVHVEKIRALHPDYLK